jgi:hypothetical protein
MKPPVIIQIIKYQITRNNTEWGDFPERKNILAADPENKLETIVRIIEKEIFVFSIVLL